MNSEKSILVLGATGYVGKRLVPHLLDSGYRVRVGVRSLAKLKATAWYNHAMVECVVCDVLDYDSLLAACRQISNVYYLVHSMNPGQKDFAATDRVAAENMARASKEAEIERIIYLAGLGEENEDLSEHLKSRREVEKILKAGETPVTIFRAAMIIGSGSASFEILRYLVDRLPLMVTPRWVSTRSQPIAIRNVLYYLIECLRVPATCHETLEIGGKEILTYRQLMEIYACEAKLPKRCIIPVPVLTPRLSSYWIHLVTPIYASIAQPLAEGLRNEVVVKDQRAEEWIPQRLLNAQESVRLALDINQYYDLEGRSEKPFRPCEWKSLDDPFWAGGCLLKDEQEVVICESPEKVWKIVSRIGGETGWYYADWLWRLRGTLDKILGGIGMRQGHPKDGDLKRGDKIDFWKVEAVTPNKGLLLIAEMKLPGLAMLSFELEIQNSQQTLLKQRASFVPRGLFGLLYWYLLIPFHFFIFRGMIREIARRSSTAV